MKITINMDSESKKFWATFALMVAFLVAAVVCSARLEDAERHPIIAPPPCSLKDLPNYDFLSRKEEEIRKFQAANAGTE